MIAALNPVLRDLAAAVHDVANELRAIREANEKGDDRDRESTDAGPT